MSFSKKLKEAGFKAYGITFSGVTQQGNIITPINGEKMGFSYFERTDWNPNDNYHGASLYSPDVILLKENKTVIISLQGVSTPQQDKEEYKKIEDLWKNRKIRYICFKESDNILFETFSGEIVPEEIINKFLTTL